MLQSVAESMLKEGHEVTVVCAPEGYAPRKGKPDTGKDAEQSDQEMASSRSRMRCKRVRATTFGRSTVIGKLTDYVTFYLGVAWYLATMSKRPDRVVAMTTPPYLSLLARCFSKMNGADHAHWVMDLYPDAMLAHGILKEGSIWHRGLEALTRWGFGGGRCACVLSLGPDMAQRVREYVPTNPERPWVPLWSNGGLEAPIDEGAVRRMRADRGWGQDDLILMYSGNMGLGHLFDEILEVAMDEQYENVSPKEANLRYVFFGMGKRRAEIERAVRENPESRVEIHGYCDACDLQTHLSSADVHFVSLRPEWDGVMVPSKLQGIFAIGRPVIFIGSEQSSIGRWVIESGGGWVVEPGNTLALKEVLDESRCATERHRRGEAARDYARTYFECEENARECAQELCRPRN